VCLQAPNLSHTLGICQGIADIRFVLRSRLLCCVLRSGSGDCDGCVGSAVVVRCLSRSSQTQQSRCRSDSASAAVPPEREADAYWRLVADRRKVRIAKRKANQEILLDDYVLTQPPTYSGPPKPVDPSGAPEEPPPVPKYVPVKADFLRSAAEYFQFTPQEPETELQYKRAYAKVAFGVGLTKEQIVRIYAFEAGGTGTYDVQAGLEIRKPGARAISTALGYNQLLGTNSVELMAEHGDQFVRQLKKTSCRSRSPIKGTI
jgi:hypothetical protein